jgi:protein regulator of cytokinesis 1
LERCLELRRSSLSSFVLAARREIELLWEELMLSEDEKGDFGGFINGVFTLTEHLRAMTDDR